MVTLEQLYETYFRDVYLYLKGLTGQEHLAQDLTSETFLKAMQGLDRFRGDCDVRVWLCQIAKNAYYSHLRSTRREVLQEPPEETHPVDLEQAFLSQESSMRLYQLLHQLPEPYKEVFVLRVLGELSFRQIAHVFGKTENWACVTYHRAKNKIKERMEGWT